MEFILSDLEREENSELLQQQTILAKFGELALKSEDLDEILTEACRLIGDALGTDLAKVVELQEDGHTLLVRAGVGWKPGIVGQVKIEATDETSEGHALRTLKPMISPDIGTETRFNYPPFLTDNGVKAVANVVIIGGKNRPPFGILQIDSRTPRKFTQSDTTFLQSYANLLAAAVDRLRAVEEVRREEGRLRLALEARVAERTSELLRANELLEEFASSISHDLRAPLRGMEGFARILLDDFGPALGQAGNDYARRIVSAAKRMEGLIADLLTYSRLQRSTIRLRNVDPTPIATAAAEDAKGGATNRADITIKVDQLPPVSGHPVVLSQVLGNLLSNAVKFRRPDGAVHVHVRAERTADRVRLWVEDDGIGIAQEDFERIFIAFQRLHGEEAYPGTGIGLAIVKIGTARMGGSCGVVSSEGAGARFWIELEAEAISLAGAALRGEDDGPDVHNIDY